MLGAGKQVCVDPPRITASTLAAARALPPADIDRWPVSSKPTARHWHAAAADRRDRQTGRTPDRYLV